MKSRLMIKRMTFRFGFVSRAFGKIEMKRDYEKCFRGMAEVNLF